MSTPFRDALGAAVERADRLTEENEWLRARRGTPSRYLDAAFYAVLGAILGAAALAGAYVLLASR